MLININRARHLELVGEDIPNDENREFYLLIKVQPTSREEKGDDIIQKVGVDNGLAILIPHGLAVEVIRQRDGTTD
jgi:hypothetical protein